MYDNGLLKYYNKFATGEGYLDTTKIGFVKNLDMVMFKATRCQIEGKSYYVKSHSLKGILHKPQADAEILLSQIYSKLGIPSSIYLPAQHQGEKFLLCDDVEKPNVVLATNYLAERFNAKHPMLTPFLSSTRTGANSQKLYTKNAMQQQTKMRILDTASYNTDRHYANFFYTLQRDVKPQTDYSLHGQVINYFRSLVPNKVEDVVAIDFESSGGNIQTLQGGRDANEPFNSYMNDFKPGVMTRSEMLTEIQTNDCLAELIDKQELAESIGSLDPSGVASDIEETTGYEIDPKMVDTLAKSYDEMAELLIK